MLLPVLQLTGVLLLAAAPAVPSKVHVGELANGVWGHSHHRTYTVHIACIGVLNCAADEAGANLSPGPCYCHSQNLSSEPLLLLGWLWICHRPCPMERKPSMFQICTSDGALTPGPGCAGALLQPRSSQRQVATGLQAGQRRHSCSTKPLCLAKLGGRTMGWSRAIDTEKVEETM
jgi:hypothetical protein